MAIGLGALLAGGGVGFAVGHAIGAHQGPVSSGSGTQQFPGDGTGRFPGGPQGSDQGGAQGGTGN